jgi:hypothetical protein
MNHDNAEKILMPFTDKVFSKNAKRTWDSFFGHLKYGFLWAFFIDFKILQIAESSHFRLDFYTNNES